MMRNSNSRADFLFWSGTVLLILSLACPIAATWVYYSIEPFSRETVQEFISLNKEFGGIAKDISIPTGRDWHILLGGITFGFLCLAAARGILSQQSLEMKTYFELGQRARYFERIDSMVEIILKNGNQSDNSKKEVIELLRDKMLIDYSKIERSNEDKSNKVPSLKSSELINLTLSAIEPKSGDPGPVLKG